MKRLTTPFLVLLMAAAPALAQTPTDFADVDTDANGAISWDEASAVLPNLTEDAFKAADTDTSGDLSEEEYLKLLSAAAP